MNITKTDTGVLNAVIDLKIEKQDYSQKVEKATREISKKASINGFRPGKVPFGLIKKMYGKSVLIDEVQKILSDELWNYITNNKIEILGEPLPISNNINNVNLDSEPIFEFSFEIGISPDVNIEINESDKINKYNITIDDKNIEEYTKYYQNYYGKMVDVDCSSDKSSLTGKIIQLNADNSEKENGIVNESAKFLISVISDEEIKNKFIGLKKGDNIVFDIKKAFVNDYELSGILNIKKENLSLSETNFKFIVNEIKDFISSENNQELWDKVYGKDTVTSEEQFTEKIKEEISNHNLEDSNRRIKTDIKNRFLEKATFELPHEFIKKWLKAKNDKEITDEVLEKEYPSFEKDYKWQLIINKYKKENNLEVTEDEIFQLAQKIAIAQFYQYGMTNVPEQYINEMADKAIKNEKDKHRYSEIILEEKVIEILKNKINFEQKEISKEEFLKLKNEL